MIAWCSAGICLAFKVVYSRIAIRCASESRWIYPAWQVYPALREALMATMETGPANGLEFIATHLAEHRGRTPVGLDGRRRWYAASGK